MHELGTVFYVIKEVEKVVEENNLSRVGSVTLQIGEVSGIIPEYIVDCWNWARKETKYLKEAELIVENIEAITYCTNCQKNYPTMKYAKICPYCQSEETYLIQGNEYTIKEIAAE